jgi:hypothetical protein
MRFLFDTNVLIPLEPTSTAETEPGTPNAVELVRLIQENGHQINVHAASRTDLMRDRNVNRRDFRLALLRKYPELPHPPIITSALTDLIGHSEPGTNDHCDDLLLAALKADAVDLLVTEDDGLQRKAKRAGLADRTLTVLGAIQVILDLSVKPFAPPPTVERTEAHTLDQTDPIFNDLRKDYPGFDEWLRMCKREHRPTWIIQNPLMEGIAAFCIVNEERNPPEGLTGRILKVCTFKVSQRSLGFRYGELLLKTVFEHAFGNNYEWAYVTVFNHHPELIRLLEDFGFSRLDKKTSLGEHIYAKPVLAEAEGKETLSALDYHIRYGPRRFLVDEEAVYLVPIQPRYADRLFPETAVQLLFHDDNPCGSAIRKAYLCHSQIKALPSGSVLVFYRSERIQGLIAVGIVEQTFRSRNREEVAREVAKRTVYSLEEISGMCEKEVLVILFRQAIILDSVVLEMTAIEHRIMKRAPQSVMKVRKEGLPWLRELICQ